MPTSLEILVNKAITDSVFQDAYERLEESAANFRILNNPNSQLEDHAINYLIKLSSLIALSPDETHQKLSQKINALIFDVLGQKELISYAIQIISSRLGNIPAITQSKVFQENNIYKLLENEASEVAFDPEIVSNLDSEKILAQWIIKNKAFYFNLYQREIIEELNKYNLVSFSAPTSFGKSFVVRFHISRLYSEEKIKRTLIIVPTKALIDDFFESLLQFKHDLNLSFSIKTHARNVTEETTPEQCIFILTQERLSFLMSKSPDFVKKFDLIYCDEAHYISRGYRGFVLRDVLTRLINLCGIFGVNSNTKYIFTSPLITNPSYYEQKLFANKEGVNPFHAEISYSPVEKNLYLVEKDDLQYQYYLLKESQINASFKNKLYKVGEPVTFHIQDYINNPEISSDIAIVCDRKLAGKNILYTPSPIAAHKYGFALSKILEETEFINDQDVIDIEHYINDHFSQDFNLIQMIKKGIGLHYGPMPIGLRRAMVQLYEKGKISYLICTSTLLEGVNLPANNIFVFSTKKDLSGHTPLSFWNLVGRAGRVTYGLSGNVVCIGKKVIEYKKLIENKEIEIEDPEIESTHTAIRRTRLIETFTKNDFSYARATKIRSDIEYLIYELLTKRDPKTILKSCSLDADIIDKLLPYITLARQDILLPIEVLEKNPGIDPRLQNKLYKFLSNDINKTNVLGMFSIVQNIRGVNSDQIFKILEVSRTELMWPLRAHESDSISRKIAQWLQEMSVADFIRQRTQHIENSDDPAKYFEKIEVAVDIIRDLENSVAFLTPKYIKCVFDLGMYILQQSGISIDSLAENVEKFLFAIEAGVSSLAARYLFEKGVSRNIAIKASNVIEEIIVNEGFDDEFFNKPNVREKLAKELSKLAYQELMEHLE